MNDKILYTKLLRFFRLISPTEYEARVGLAKLGRNGCEAFLAKHYAEHPPRIAIHVHLYYTEQWAELASCIANVPKAWLDVFVTLVRNDPELRGKILEYDHKATVRGVENRWYDVGPFIDVINRLDLDAYDYVVKLHTKRDIQRAGVRLLEYNMSGAKWRNNLLSFLKTKKDFLRTIAIFEIDERIGMIGAERCVLLNENNFPDSMYAIDLLRWLNTNRCRREFVTETMFMVRACLLKIFQGKVGLRDFSITTRANVTPAHEFASAFGYLASAQGRELVGAELFYKRTVFLGRLKGVFLQYGVTQSHHFLCEDIQNSGISKNGVVKAQGKNIGIPFMLLSGKRYAIFEHYDRDVNIAPYVLYYLEQLKEVVSTIVYVSDGELSDTKKTKLNDVAQIILAERHGEYDFGSYKQGLRAIQDQLMDGDELIFFNDSCFGPFVCFREIFKKMKNVDCSMWGCIMDQWTKSLMSFFLVLSSSVFLSEYFHKFIYSVKTERCKDVVVMKYEVGLSKLVGTLASYIKPCAIHKMTFCEVEKRTKDFPLMMRILFIFFLFFLPRTVSSEVNNIYLLAVRFPFLKKLAFIQPEAPLTCIFYKRFIGQYPPKLVADYLKRMDYCMYLGERNCLMSIIRCKVIRCIFQSGISSSNHRSAKIFKIPVYRKLIS